MPAKNKPKRLDRARAWRVRRRKQELDKLTRGTKRSRGKRPKHKRSEITTTKK